MGIRRRLLGLQRPLKSRTMSPFLETIRHMTVCEVDVALLRNVFENIQKISVRSFVTLRDFKDLFSLNRCVCTYLYA